MTEKKLRHIAVVIDRSGSMRGLEADTEGGLRAFLGEQSDIPGDAKVWLYEFDSEFEAVCEGVALADVPDYKLKPRGMTALLDAIGRTAATLDAAQDEKPTVVVLVIATDGHENSSEEYTLEMISTLLNKKRRDGWNVVFIGADQDAFAAGQGLGVPTDSTLSYASEQTLDAWDVTGKMVARGTVSGIYAYTDDERRKAR